MYQVRYKTQHTYGIRLITNKNKNKSVILYVRVGEKKYQTIVARTSTNLTTKTLTFTNFSRQDISHNNRDAFGRLHKRCGMYTFFLSLQRAKVVVSPPNFPQ